MSTKVTAPRNIRTWSDWEAAVKEGACTAAEQQLVAACLAGQACTLGDGTRPTAPATDREIGADLLRYLITGGCEACSLHEWGVEVEGAYIKAPLDLRQIRAVGVTIMTDCHFQGQIDAINARLELLHLGGGHCAGLNAQGADVKGSVFLRDGFASKGAVSLSSAVIGGQLDCSGGSFDNAEGDALNAQGADVKGDVFLRDGFTSKGEVNLSGAVIGGQISCVGGSFENAEGYALNAESADVKGDVFLRDDFKSKGAVSLSGAVIGGQLSCSGGSFNTEEGDALNAQGAEVKGDVFFRDGFTSKGSVRLSSAMIGGQLACSGGSFDNAEGDALNAQGADVKGSVFFSDGFTSKGVVRLTSAVIGGQLSCHAGSFANAKGVALNAQGAEMSALFWRGVTRCDGGFNLTGAKAKALTDDAQSWAVVAHIYLDGFTYQTIHGPLDAQMRLAWLKTAVAYDGSFSPLPYEQLAWVLKRMGHEEQRTTILVEKEKRQRGSVRDRLRSRRRFARAVSQLSKRQDDARVLSANRQLHSLGPTNSAYGHHLTDRYKFFHNSWPKQAKAEAVAAEEIARAQAGFREQIFWDNGRTRIIIAWLYIKEFFARRLVGYGYRPFNFIWALLLLIGIGWGVAHQAYERGDFAPNSDVILSTVDWQRLAEGDSANPAEAWSADTGKGRDYETFNSFAYAIDVVIPIVSIGQEAAWAPSTNRGIWGTTLWWLRWLLTIAGWIVTAVGAAAIAGMIRRE